MIYSKTVFLCLALALFLCSQISSAQFPQAVAKYMATRQMRYHHYMWHQLRDNWNSFSESTKNAFRKINWEPPNPSRDRKGNLIRNNKAGEEFLYMHRQMIATAKQVATQNNQSTASFVGWDSIPAPGNTSYPVPVYNQYSTYKSKSYYDQMKKMETKLKDAAQLKKMTLNELGIQLENDIHNAMHLRWSDASSVGYRSGGSASSGVPKIDKKWDDVKYNWLADTYSSHCNPIFWRIHGWVDARVEDWRKANGLTSIRWNGTWVGGQMSSLGSVLSKTVMGSHLTATNDVDPETVGDILQQAIEILENSGVREFTFEDALKKDKRRKKKRR